MSDIFVLTRIRLGRNGEDVLIQHPDDVPVLSLLKTVGESFFKSHEGIRFLSSERSPKSFTYYDILEIVPARFFEECNAKVVKGFLQEEELPVIPFIDNPAKISLKKIPGAYEFYQKGMRISNIREICETYNIHGRGYNITRPRARCRKESDWELEGHIINHLIDMFTYLERTEGTNPPKQVQKEISAFLTGLVKQDMLEKYKCNQMLQSRSYLSEFARAYYVMRSDVFQRYGKSDTEVMYYVYKTLDFTKYKEKNQSLERW